jgi:hypothetical protein
MAKQIRYRQVRLQRSEGNKTIETVSWIPIKHAKVGHLVSLKDDDGNWSPDYKVISVSNHVLDETPDWRKMIRGHRKQTGDSSPKVH